MDSKELSYWIAYYKIFPFGDERADLRNALNCSILANANSKKRFKPEDFMFNFGKKKKRMDGMEMKNIVKKYMSKG